MPLSASAVAVRLVQDVRGHAAGGLEAAQRADGADALAGEAEPPRHTDRRAAGADGAAVAGAQRQQRPSVLAYSSNGTVSQEPKLSLTLGSQGRQGCCEADAALHSLTLQMWSAYVP